MQVLWSILHSIIYLFTQIKNNNIYIKSKLSSSVVYLNIETNGRQTDVVSILKLTLLASSFHTNKKRLIILSMFSTFSLSFGRAYCTLNLLGVVFCSVLFLTSNAVISSSSLFFVEKSNRTLTLFSVCESQFFVVLSVGIFMGTCVLVDSPEEQRKWRTCEIILLCGIIYFFVYACV